MQVKISTIIDIPDGMLLPGYEYGSACEYIHDNLTNYVTCAHFKDAMKWRVKAMGVESSTEYLIYKSHHDFGEISKKLKWSYEQLENE